MFELDTPGQQLTLGALAGLAPEVLKKSLERLRANGGETGLPREERRKRLDAVFARHRVSHGEDRDIARGGEPVRTRRWCYRS